MEKLKAYILLVIGLLPTAVCWSELLYRLRLYKECGSQPFLNHVADGYFGIMYIAASIASAILILGVILSIRSKSIPRIILYSLAAVLALSFIVVLFFMNQQAILVTYSEFLNNM